jgi:hypothetical protein
MPDFLYFNSIYFLNAKKKITAIYVKAKKKYFFLHLHL